jgi:hypothetical protein
MPQELAMNAAAPQDHHPTHAPRPASINHGHDRTAAILASRCIRYGR